VVLRSAAFATRSGRPRAREESRHASYLVATPIQVITQIGEFPRRGPMTSRTWCHPSAEARGLPGERKESPSKMMKILSMGEATPVR
jgi:hypothetical protein